MSGLQWFRMDTNLPTHDKILDLVGVREGYRAAFVYTCGLAYAAGHSTDGLVPFNALHIVHGTRRHAELLVEHGLWKPHPKGWEIPNWLERQQSSVIAESIRAAESTGGRRGACARWHEPGCECWKRGA